MIWICPLWCLQKQLGKIKRHASELKALHVVIASLQEQVCLAAAELAVMGNNLSLDIQTGRVIAATC